MKPRRRTFLLLALFFAGLAVLRAAPLPEGSWDAMPPHPRLLANAARWEELKKAVATQEMPRAIFAAVRAVAERSLGQPPVEYVDKGAYWHGPMRQAQGRILSLAMTYRLTGEARFLDRARLEMKTMAELPTWYPQHFLDTAEGALGMAIGLDWLHDALTPEERDEFATAIIEKALRASLKVAEEKSWVGGANNWTPVCHGGMLIGALAVAEREPALARQIVARALQHMPRYAQLYAPAGAYSEGPDYWSYGTTFYVLMAEALRTTFGTTCELEGAPGFLQTSDYTRQLTAPSGAGFNFADNGDGSGSDSDPVMYWFARERHRADLIAKGLADFKNAAITVPSGGPTPNADRMLAFTLLWLPPASAPAPALAPAPPPLVWWSEGGSQPQAVMRSAWGDRRATFVGIKAGQADDSHAHMDIGSFILEASGVRWAVDLGRESYPHARANGIPNVELFSTHQDSPRWSIFRCGPESHNLLRFDNAPQRVEAKAEIRPAPASEEGPGFIVDLTPVVAGQVVSAERRFNIRADRSVVIRDDWKTGDTATGVSWQWVTGAAVTREADGFTLSQSGQTLRLRATGSATLDFAIEDVSAPRNKFDSPNPGLSRLIIRLQTPAQSTGSLSVMAVPAH